MKAILVTLLLVTSAAAQYVPAWEQCCPDGSCPAPDYGPSIGPSVIWRPQPMPSPPPALPPQQQPEPARPEPPIQQCDCATKWEAFEKWKAEFKAEILAAIKENAAKPGPPGPAGPPGKDGKDGAPAKPVEQPTNHQHVVIVADQNAPYWQRLAEQIANTKKTYHGVQVSGMPDFPIGLHPQAVVYKNSVPVRVVKGQYEVEALLSRLARGEVI